MAKAVVFYCVIWLDKLQKHQGYVNLMWSALRTGHTMHASENCWWNSESYVYRIWSMLTWASPWWCMIAIVRQFAMPCMLCSIHTIVTCHTCYLLFFGHRLLILSCLLNCLHISHLSNNIQTMKNTVLPCGTNPFYSSLSFVLNTEHDSHHQYFGAYLRCLHSCWD